MAKLELKSFQQIVSTQIAKVLSELGINDINPGSVLLTLLETSSQEDFAQYVQMVNIIRNYNLDTTTGDELDTRAFEYGLTRRDAQKATGKVIIQRPASFEKVSTTFYSGSPTPIAGDTMIRVNDASNVLFGTSGTLIIGRGTTNEEEVTYSVAPTDFTNYWQFTISSLSNDHGLDETVILKQGNNELIPAGTLIQVPATGTSDAITFTTNNDVTLLAGEDQITDVEITASIAGSAGNVAIKAIEGEAGFTSAPFVGARVYNDSKFTTGRDRETDDQLRDRIKSTVQSLSKGTKTAILNAIVGLVDSETAKRVVSANVILPTELDQPVKIYIDDGTGFEPSFTSVGYEIILEQSTGGEQRLQLDLSPLVKAQVESNFHEPYNLSGGSKTLIYEVGIASETITLVPDDFEFPESAKAEEIVTAINNKSNLLEARTSDTGTGIVVMAKADTNENIQIIGGTANSAIGFSTDRKETLFLYVDDVLLSKDGTTSFVDAGNQETYNFAGLGAGPWTMQIVVDGKTANTETITFNSGDFTDDANATADEVVDIINEQLAGATAELINNDTTLRIYSNIETSTKSKVHVLAGPVQALLGFSTTQSVGTEKDYTLNRELSTIELVEPLEANQMVTAGSRFTRAKLRTDSPEFYAITSGQTLVVSVDGAADQTVTFSSTGTFSAAQIAALINAQLQGATAVTREVGLDIFVEISTNTYNESSGSIQVKSSSTATTLDFHYDQVAVNGRPHKAFTVSNNTAPFSFPENSSLVIIVDNNPITKTFTVVFDYDGTVTSITNASQFSVNAFNTIFPSNGNLVGYSVAFKTGPNTTTGSVTDVVAQGGGIFRYLFSALPSGLASYAAGDLVTFTGLANSTNNGSFIITTVNTTGNGYIQVQNTSGVNETLATGSALLSQKRTISNYTGGSGEITVSVPFSNVPASTNQLIVIPRTIKNVVEFMNNTKITTLSTKATIEAVEQNTKVQISSDADGSDGYIRVTGGSANQILAFSTTLFRGLQGYNYYTGLLKLVHRTIYGDDQDLVAYPGVGAAGINFQILAPTVQELAFSIDVSLSEGVSISNVENEIKSAVAGYVNNLGVGQDVILAEIVDAVMSVDNVTDMVINSPETNIVIADNELARTRDSLILIG